jgi:hypothetical protein
MAGFFAWIENLFAYFKISYKIISMKFNFKKYLRIFSHVLFWGAVGAVGALAAMVLIYGNDLPDYKKLATYAPPVATRPNRKDISSSIGYWHQAFAIAKNIQKTRPLSR